MWLVRGRGQPRRRRVVCTREDGDWRDGSILEAVVEGSRGEGSIVVSGEG